jgi:glycosyltransferase involved in cell wall biosynthesis
VHRTVVYLARALGNDQFEVDLLTYSAPVDDSIHLLNDLPVNVYHLRKGEDGSTASKTRRNIAARIRGRLKRLYEYACLAAAPTTTLFHGSVRRTLRTLFRQRRYALVIAVEKGGLALAGDALRYVEFPLAYYSLELYTSDHPLLNSDPRMTALHRLESKFASPKHAYIIQDDARWNVLKRDLGIEQVRTKILFPVSEPAEPCPESSRFLRDRLAIPDEKKILLYYGVVRPERDSLSVAAIADELPDDWVLVFHGPCHDDTAERILGRSARRKIVMSRALIPSAQREQLIKSADVGLAIYCQTNANDRLTGSSSEKIALYLKCGVPIIGHNNESYAHIWAQGGGLGVSAISEIPAAINIIAPRLGNHRISARRVYEEHYSFERNYLRAIAAMSDLGLYTLTGRST